MMSAWCESSSVSGLRTPFQTKHVMVISTAITTNTNKHMHTYEMVIYIYVYLCNLQIHIHIDIYQQNKYSLRTYTCFPWLVDDPSHTHHYQLTNYQFTISHGLVDDPSIHHQLATGIPWWSLHPPLLPPVLLWRPLRLKAQRQARAPCCERAGNSRRFAGFRELETWAGLWSRLKLVNYLVNRDH